jgi:RimJ/RimL family protein N-acetyltransferase
VQRVLEFASAQMGLRRIEAHIDLKNWRSLRLAERLGFVRESERENDVVYAMSLSARGSGST